MSNPSTTLNLRARHPGLFWWPATVIWAGFIYYLSTASFGSSWTEWVLREILRALNFIISSHAFFLLHLVVRKLAHIIEYAILGFFLYGSFSYRQGHRWSIRAALLSTLVAVAYSLSDEFHQAFVPNRTSSWIDCGIDTAGSAFSMLFLYFYRSERFFNPPGRVSTDAQAILQGVQHEGEIE